MNNNLIPHMDAKTKEAVIRKLLVAQGITPTTDDEICFKSMRLLASATDKIARLTLDKPQKEIPLADIEIGERHSISDLPDLVATDIAQPFGSLGDGWANFAQKAEYSMRGKLSRCAIRKLSHASDRLELAIGCLKWADLVGVHDIPQFQAAFTSALILDKAATTELNGETIDIKPEATKMPFDKSVWIQILDGVKSLLAGQEKIKSTLEATTTSNPQDDVASLVYEVYMSDRIWKDPFPGERRKRRKSIHAAVDYVRFKCTKTDTEFYDRCTDARTAIANLGKKKDKVESLWRTIAKKKAKPSGRGDKSNKRKTYTKSDMIRYNEEHGGDTDNHDERMIYPIPNGW